MRLVMNVFNQFENNKNVSTIFKIGNNLVFKITNSVTDKYNFGWYFDFSQTNKNCYINDDTENTDIQIWLLIYSISNTWMADA